MIRTFRIDDRVVARVGYEDGRVELDIDVPPPLSVLKSKITYVLTAEGIRRSVPAVLAATDLLKKLGLWRK